MLGGRWIAAALVLLAAGSAWEACRPALTIVGNVTLDMVNGKPSLGGAVAYAAAVASAFGVRACIVTAAGPGMDLSALSGHDLHIVPASETLTFEHTYTYWGNARRLRVTAQPNVTLTMAHVPPRCRRARVMLLGPLMPADMDPASFLPASSGGRGSHALALMAQGLQRSLDAGKKVVPLHQPSPQLLAALGPSTTVYLSDVETDAWPPGTIEGLAARTARFLVTRGALGADDHERGRRTRRPPFPVDAVVDTNGAGDCFATGHVLARAALRHAAPGAVANWAGGVAVSQPQTCKPACITQAMRAGWAVVPRLEESGGEARVGTGVVPGALGGPRAALRAALQRLLPGTERLAQQATL
ncbi:hypothetical protein ACKKBG_A35340 [Auxenochlorella protothecoides x Auxenochlorella symbiontica]